MKTAKFNFWRLLAILGTGAYLILAFTQLGESFLVNTVEPFFPVGTAALRVWVRFVGWFQDTAFLQIVLFAFLYFLKKEKSPAFLNAANAQIARSVRFFKNNAGVFCAGFVALTLIYGSQFYMFNVRLDTDSIINNGGTYIWLDIGRYGAAFTRYLTDQLHFNPYFVSALGFVVLFAAMVAFAALLFLIARVPIFLSVLTFCIFFSHPVWMAQTYYTLQVVAINWGILLCVLAVFFIFQSVGTQSIKAKFAFLAAGILSIFWLSATYQSLFLLFVTLAILSVVLCRRQFAPQFCRKLSVWLGICGIVGFAAHSVIAYFFFSGDMDYLTHRACWGTLPANICVASTFFSIERLLTGALNFSAFYSRFFLFVMAAVLVAAWRFKQSFGLVLLLQTLPFLMIFATGVDQVPRSQLALPFVIAADVLLLWIFLSETKNFSKWILAGASALLFLAQAGITMRLQYTDDLRFQNDVLLANRVEERLATLNLLEKPVIFVGEKARLNAVTSKERGEYIGESLAIYYRFHDFAQTQGISFAKVAKEKEEELRQKAVELSAEMPDFPHKDSVKETENFVLVKLNAHQPR